MKEIMPVIWSHSCLVFVMWQLSTINLTQPPAQLYLLVIWTSWAPSLPTFHTIIWPANDTICFGRAGCCGQTEHKQATLFTSVYDVIGVSLQILPLLLSESSWHSRLVPEIPDGSFSLTHRWTRLTNSARAPVKTRAIYETLRRLWSKVISNRSAK